MTTTKKRNISGEIREGLEAYRDRRATLPQRKPSAPHLKAVRERFGMSQADMASATRTTCRRELG